MSTLAGCVVHLNYGGSHVDEIVVKPEHYEQLKDMLDRGETGWLELRTVFSDGSILLRVENIADIMLAPPAYCRELDEWRAQTRLENQ